MTDFTKTRDFFHIPPGITYLDGNSLGLLPKTVGARVAQVVAHEWGEQLITAWNGAGWMDLPARVGDRIAPLIGAGAGQVMVGDTLSIKLFQALTAALAMRPDRRVILSDHGNFPSDLYVAEGVARAMGARLCVVAPQEVQAALDTNVAVLMLTEVDYRTARRHDMAALTERAHQVGALALWDLAHSAGAIEVDLLGTGADFAVGCSYKYLNGGPGAPGFIWTHPRHVGRVRPMVQGWLGHARPFEFAPDYDPAPGAGRLRIGTPPVLALSALEAALAVWDGVTMAEVEARAQALADRFIAGVEARCPEVRLLSPREAGARGSHVSFCHPHAYAIMQALIARGVIGDMRAPDVLRFGITPLYLGEAEIDHAVQTLAEVIDRRLWDRPEWQQKQFVT